MSELAATLLRVCLHTARGPAELGLPATVPVAALLPDIVELLDEPTTADPPVPYRLARPGGATLRGAPTLAEQGIDDGALLVLIRDEPPVRPVHRIDAAEALTRAGPARSAAPAQRAVAVSAAAGLAGLAGFLVVPGGPGAPNALLATVAAATVALPAGQVVGAPATLPVGLAGLGLLGALAVAALLLGVPPVAVAAVAAVAGIGLLRVASRAVAAVAGLARHRSNRPAASARAALSAMVAVGTAVTVTGVLGLAVGPGGWAPTALSGACASALGLQIRRHRTTGPTAALAAGCAAAIGLTLWLAAAWMPGPAVAALALLSAAGAVALGSRRAGPLRWVAAPVESLTLAALLPLAAQVCGVFAAVRGLSLR